MNDRLFDPNNLHQVLRFKGPQVVTEYVQQAAYARQIFLYSVNTLRILTLWDDRQRGPFIDIAVQRLGSPASAPVDNVVQADLSAEVDLCTGVLGRAAYFLPDGCVCWESSHPYSSAQVEGVQIPNWSDLVTELLVVSAEFPCVPNIGWDVIVTDSGFKGMEGNNFTGLQFLQEHRGLLADPRVCAFYQRWRVI